MPGHSHFKASLCYIRHWPPGTFSLTPHCWFGAYRQLEEDQKKLQEWRTRDVMAAAGAGDIGGEGGGGSGKGSKKKKKGKAAADEFETFIDDGVPQRQPKNQDERVSESQQKQGTTRGCFSNRGEVDKGRGIQVIAYLM
jgi:hypothetical protein